MGKTIINQPFGNSLYRVFMVIWGMVYYCFTDIGHVVSQCFTCSPPVPVSRREARPGAGPAWERSESTK